MPQIQLVEPEGTYLAWLDCRELGMTDDELMAFFSDEAKVWRIRARIRVNRDLDLCALIWEVRAVCAQALDQIEAAMEKTERTMKNSRTVKIKRSEGLHGI